MTRGERRTGAGVTALVLCAVTRAAADPAPTPPMHFASASSVRTDGGTDLRLPPGYFLDEPTWSMLDAETKRLQTVETKLRAENSALRVDVAGWQPGWYTVLIAVAGGGAIGWYLHDRL